MNATHLTFHHFGLAVRRPDAAFDFHEALGYVRGEAIYDPLQAVNVAMLHHPSMPDVEVVWPGSGPSPIDNLIKGGKTRVYHLCYATENADLALVQLREVGLKVVELVPPKPAVLFGGLHVSFHNVLQVGLVEIIHGTPSSREFATSANPAGAL